MVKKYICPRCRSEYDLWSAHVPMRDEDSIDCEVCGKEIIHWNGSRIWHSKLVKRGQRPSDEGRTTPI